MQFAVFSARTIIFSVCAVSSVVIFFSVQCSVFSVATILFLLLSIDKEEVIIHTKEAVPKKKEMKIAEVLQRGHKVSSSFKSREKFYELGVTEDDIIEVDKLIATKVAQLLLKYKDIEKVKEVTKLTMDWRSSKGTTARSAIHRRHHNGEKIVIIYQQIKIEDTEKTLYICENSFLTF